jgi:hypothetical protein
MIDMKVGSSLQMYVWGDVMMKLWRGGKQDQKTRARADYCRIYFPNCAKGENVNKRREGSSRSDGRYWTEGVFSHWGYYTGTGKWRNEGDRRRGYYYHTSS